MARISVIVPAYNVEEYLADCLDSVLDLWRRSFWDERYHLDVLGRSGGSCASNGWTICSRCWSSPRCASAGSTSWPSVPARL